MPFKFRELEIPGLILVEPMVFSDDRGFFMETYKYSDFARSGITERFVQDNHSRTVKGVLRGLHYQKRPAAQGTLVRVARGEVFDVAVDIRFGSPTYGKWVAKVISADSGLMLYIPAGCAHGFYALSGELEILYKMTGEYAPEHEAGIRWDDEEIGIEWPDRSPYLTQRDKTWPSLSLADNNFTYDGGAA